MTGGTAPVAVVVVTWNSAPYIDECLSSLGSLERPPAEIVVVDNGSGDGTPERVRRQFPLVSLVETGTNAGFCRANNLGIARTTSPFVLVLNPDTRLASRFLEELLPSFDDPSVGIACGKLLRMDGITLDSAGQDLARSRQPIDRGYGTSDRGQYDDDGEVFSACGAAALYRRAMLRGIADPDDAYFDEEFFAYYEDLDLAWRARKLGWRAVYRHRAVGYHARGGSTGSPGPRRFAALWSRSSEIRFHATKNRYLTILRNDEPLSYLRDLPFILGRDVATAGLLLLTSPAVLLRLFRARGTFRRALGRRGLDAARPRDHVSDGGRG